MMRLLRTKRAGNRTRQKNLWRSIERFSTFLLQDSDENIKIARPMAIAETIFEEDNFVENRTMTEEEFVSWWASAARNGSMERF